MLTSPVNNDFHDSHGIFDLFKDTKIPDLNKPFHVVNGSSTNGHADAPTNGVNGTNGDSHTASN